MNNKSGCVNTHKWKGSVYNRQQISLKAETQRQVVGHINRHCTTSWCSLCHCSWNISRRLHHHSYSSVRMIEGEKKTLWSLTYKHSPPSPQTLQMPLPFPPFLLTLVSICLFTQRDPLWNTAAPAAERCSQLSSPRGGAVPFVCLFTYWIPHSIGHAV